MTDLVKRDELRPLVERAAELVQGAKSSNTRRAYRVDWTRFEAWCAASGLPALPPSGQTVMLHLTHLEKEGLRLSTIERALAGIAFELRAQGHEWVTPKALSEWIRGLRRAQGVKRDKKAPADDQVLRRMVAGLPANLRGARDQAILLVGWVGCMRRSEVAALNVEDLAHRSDGLVVTLQRSKTDQEGEGEEKGLPFSQDPSVCPVLALRAWLEQARITTGAIFRSITAKGDVFGRLSDHAVAVIVKNAARAAGFDPAEFSGHSLRSGFMTAASAAGRPLEDIMKQSGHQSERVARGYIRHANVFTRNPAKGLL